MSKFKREPILDRATAEKQVDLFMEFYDIDPEFVVERIQTAIESNRLGLVKAVTRGRLSIEETDEGINVAQILKNEVAGFSRINYRELDSQAQAASRRGETVSEMLFFLLASLGKFPAEEYEKIHPEDRTVAKDLGNLFLVV